MKKVVLAYSGGIGTTACLNLLRRKEKMQVITFTANLGQRASAEDIAERALDMGASRTLVRDLREDFVTNFVWPALRASAVYGSGYALSSALARPLIVREVARIAREVGATCIAHGCAAKSNDQVRFETSAAAVAPDLQVLSPLRDNQLLRADEIKKYLKSQGLKWQDTGDCFSITENLWGTTFQFKTVPEAWDEMPESHYRLTVNPLDAPTEPQTVIIRFDQGVPIALDGKELAPVTLLENLARIAGAHGVGRVDSFEDRLIGIKTRDLYEQPAATVLHMAKFAVESLVLTRELQLFKNTLSDKYAALIYEGRWYSELCHSIEAFFDSASERVSGEVRVLLYKGSARVTGARSRNSLYSRSRATLDAAGDDFDHSNVPGLMRSISTAIKLQSQRQEPRWWSDV